MSSTWTEADIAALKQSMASGAQSVTYTSGGVTRNVTYRSLAEMKQTLNDMIKEVRGTKPRRRSNPKFDSGL